MNFFLEMWFLYPNWDHFWHIIQVLDSFDVKIQFITRTKISNFSPLSVNSKSFRFNVNKTIDLVSSFEAEPADDGKDRQTRGILNGLKHPVTINIAPSKTGTQTVNIILNDGSASKKTGENSMIESRSDQNQSETLK